MSNCRLIQSLKLLSIQAKALVDILFNQHWKSRICHPFFIFTTKLSNLAVVTHFKSTNSEEKNLFKLPLSLLFDLIDLSVPNFQQNSSGVLGRNPNPNSASAVFAEIFLLCCLEKSTKKPPHIGQILSETVQKLCRILTCRKLKSNCNLQTLLCRNSASNLHHSCKVALHTSLAVSTLGVHCTVSEFSENCVE